MNTDGTLFSMKKNSREAEAMSMTSFMIPIGLKQKLKDHAAKLGTTSTSLIIEGIRLILDRKNEATPQLEEIDTTGNMFLSIFLAMALAGLKLWELIDLAMPMVICLVLQCVVMFLFSYFVVFNVMGRNYDAAVMTAGFIGFSMGATSNAMANMQVVTKKYGPSPDHAGSFF